MLNALNTDNSPFDEPQLERLKATFSALSVPQSQWLSGYLAGLHAQAQSQPEAAGAPAEDPVLSILYGSETGNCEAIARELADGLEQSGFNIELLSLDGFRPARIRKLRRAVFVIATHGEGDPPETAVEVFEHLLGEAAPPLPDLQYRVLALGDRSYEHFCLAGRKFDERLQELGARPFGPRVDCDVDFSADSQSWRREVVEWVRENRPESVEKAAAPNLSVLPTTPRWSRERPFAARVLRSHPITGTGSDKDVHHLELSLEGSGIRYRPGDALGVWAANDRETVERLLQSLGVSANAPVRLGEDELDVEEALTHRLEITRLTEGILEQWSERPGAGALEPEFRAIDRAARRQFIERRQLIDIVEAYPAKISAQQLVDLLRPLAPRSYSIASSSDWVDDEVHLTVATLASEAIGKTRYGVASHFLNHRLQAGDEVRVYLEPNQRFRLPEDSQLPLILIGAGTGIAPYRAFLQEIEARGSGPEAWLIFGNPHLRTDFLYQREWLRWRDDGLVSRIDAAWSRDQESKRYVQHVVAEQAERLVAWLQRGAHIYICGALAMGAAVQQAVQDALAKARGLDGDAASRAMAELRRAGRYHKDLY